MRIRTVAFVPAAPLLVPAVAGGSAAVDAELRATCVGAVREAADSEVAEVVVVVAATSTGGVWPADAVADFSGFGVEGAPAAGTSVLPWPLGVGAWLLDAAGWHGARRYLGIGGGDSSPTVADRKVAVVAVGDGSACRTERAPGYLDPRAEGFDDAIARCLAAGDATTLAATDVELAAELHCAGLPVWQWVADALGDRRVAAAELRAHAAPYGVGYFAALWRVA